VVRSFHINMAPAILLHGVLLAVFGVVMKIGWWKCGLSGVASPVAMGVCQAFLLGVFERGTTSPWTAMLAGMLLTCLVAYLIGGQVLRLKGHYLAMATLGFGIIIEIVFRQWTDVTGGSADGIYGIASIDYFGSLPGFVKGIVSAAAGGNVGEVQQYYYLVWAFVFVALVLAVNIVRSRIGRAFRAVHGSEIAAESLGVDTGRYKVQVFVLSAGMASLAGSLYAHIYGVGYINPGDFGFMVSVQLVVMVVIGGMASVWGALFGASAIQLLKNYLLKIDSMDIELWGLSVHGLEPVVFGAMLIIVMIALPQGLVRGLTDGAAALLRTARRTKKSSAE
jgi:branched-chain amino acid transport system permease protein